MECPPLPQGTVYRQSRFYVVSDQDVKWEEADDHCQNNFNMTLAQVNTLAGAKAAVDLGTRSTIEYVHYVLTFFPR